MASKHATVDDLEIEPVFFLCVQAVVGIRGTRLVQLFVSPIAQHPPLKERDLKSIRKRIKRLN